MDDLRNISTPKGLIPRLGTYYEATQYFSLTARNFQVHEATVKRWVERYRDTGEVDSKNQKHAPTNIAVTPELR